MGFQLLRKNYIKFSLIAFIYLLVLMRTFSLHKGKIFKQNKAIGEPKALYKFTDNGVNEDVDSDNRKAKLYSDSDDVQHRQLMFVNTSQCRIPYVDPFTPELLAIYKPPKYLNCRNQSDLVTHTFNVNLKRYVLYINDTFARELMNSSTEKYKCYYEKIIRSKTDDSYKKSLTKKYFSQGYVVPLHVDGMLLACHLASKRSHKLQEDAFFFVQQKVPDHENQGPVPSQKSTGAKSTLRKPSVILFGIDSLSRINFRRTMPQVYEHMKRRGWFELQGYNKVADNTLPNLMAILSGYTIESSKVICDITKRGCFDRFPFIWKDFKNASYLTAYAEDSSDGSIFNYLKPGFKIQPTDFYFRPFFKAIEDNMHVFIKVMRYCIGRRIVSSYVYDFCREFMQRFVHERPIFGLFWTDHFSHDDWQMPALMSDKILQYLLDFEADGAMESTIMVFLADHGFRFGRLLKLPEGFLEERLPTMFIWLPPWFRAQYPEYVKALEINRNRLTSNYDLHMTLKHIIELGTPHDLKLPPAYDCPKCQSVFYPVPENRTCADAGIIDHWCTCNPYTVVTKHDYARVIPHLVADRINQYIISMNLAGLCSKVTPRSIDRIELKLNLNEAGKHIDQDVETFRTKFTVNPNGAEFQATVFFNNHSKAMDVDVETISRLNRYHNDSLCINDKEARKFCICYRSIKDPV